jgi:hypothetical protein
VGAAIGAIALVVAAVGAIVSAELPSSSQGAGRVASSSGAATVQRRDLIATDTESGTLGYADPETVFNRLSGTVTSLPAVGDVVKPGQALYRVDGAPVVLFDGTVPAYRSLSDGVSAGADVMQLKRNLVDLGFDTGHQITINDTFDAATTAAVDRWQASLGQPQTGAVTVGEVVFLPGAQRVSTVSAALGSNGGSSASGSGASAGGTGARTTVIARPEFVALTTSSPAPSTATQTTTTTTSTTPTTTTQTTTTPSPTSQGSRPGSGAKQSGKAPSSDAILLALLKAEILELKKELAAGGGSSRSAAGGSAAGGSSAGGGARSGGGGAVASTGTTAAGASTASASGTSGSSGATAQPILQTTSNKLVVTVNLDATKQSEAVVGQPVSVQLPSGDTVGGRITAVSSVAQSTSSSASSSSGASGSGSGSGSSAPSATIPVTIDVTGHHPLAGLDQAAVSVNFEQQVQRNVLSVPVSALLATAGGGYAIQEVAAPHRLIPVTPGLFAAGFVQISGVQIFPGLQVTDSQG